MADNIFRLAGLNVPIIKTIEIEGDAPNGVPNLSSEFDPAIDYWASGVISGVSEGKNGVVTTESYVTDESTPLTDDTADSIEIKSRPYTSVVMAFYAGISVLRNNITILQEQVMRAVQQANTSTNQTRNITGTWVALRYKYTNPSTEWAGVYGYAFAALEQDILQTSQTVTINYYRRNYFTLPLPNWNKQYGYHIQYEEIIPPSPDEPPFDPTEDPEPYDPSKDDTSDLVTIPGNPLIGVTSAGFINVYNPAIGALRGLGDILFPNVASATDIVDAVIKLCETLANQNLINYVIDCHVIPVQPQIGANANIKVGFRDTGISVPVVTNDYIDATCGALNIREYFGGFQDFLATRSKLYLPFIGFVDVRPEFWQGGTLSVDYKFNVIDGSFMCYVRSVSSKSQLNGSVIAQYAGNACLHFPLTGVNYSQMVSGIVGAAVTMASGGGSSAVLGGALSAANTIAAGGNVQQSNGYSSTAALMGVRTPFLLIERAVPAYSSKYAHDKGFPTNIATLLSNVTGYTEISDIDLTGLPFTADEITELRQLLAEGVYF